jgi:hypothetical protein
MIKCVRCSSPNDRGLGLCLGCGSDLRPMSGRLFVQFAGGMVVLTALIFILL